MVKGLLTQETGPRSSRRSRIVPPPIPVTVAIRQKPTMSICLRDAVSAPLAAKTPTPQRSSQWMKLSTERLLAALVHKSAKQLKRPEIYKTLVLANPLKLFIFRGICAPTPPLVPLVRLEKTVPSEPTCL